MKTSGLVASRCLVLIAAAGVGDAGCLGGDPLSESLQREMDAELAKQSALTRAERQALQPVLECVEKLLSGDFKAHFGYLNSSNSFVTVPIGTFNRFLPPPFIDRGQPREFAPGLHTNVVEVTFVVGPQSFGNGYARWVLGGKNVLANRFSQRCGPGGGGAGAGGSGPGSSGVGGSGPGGMGGFAPGAGGSGSGGSSAGGSGPGGSGVGGSGPGGSSAGGGGSGGAPSAVCPSSCDDLDPCTVDTCSQLTFQCLNLVVSDGTPCSDGNSCTVGDQCLSGVCSAGAPTTCTASGQCHDVGTCDPMTGVCSNPDALNGTACDDNDSCTTGESCHGGVCGIGTAVCTDAGAPDASGVDAGAPDVSQPEACPAPEPHYKRIDGVCVPSCGAAGGIVCAEPEKCMGRPILTSWDCPSCC